MVVPPPAAAELPTACLQVVLLDIQALLMHQVQGNKKNNNLQGTSQHACICTASAAAEPVSRLASQKQAEMQRWKWHVQTWWSNISNGILTGTRFT